MDELIDICDENNNIIGQAMKYKALAEGLWHRVARVLIYNPKGEVFLQLRSETKELHPGCWDVGVAGHIGAGEHYVDAASREAAEEAGLEIFEGDLELAMVEKEEGLYGGLNEKVFAYTYFARFGGNEGLIRIQEEEVQSYRFIDVRDLEAERKENPAKFSPHSDLYWNEISEGIKKRFGK